MALPVLWLIEGSVMFLGRSLYHGVSICSLRSIARNSSPGPRHVSTVVLPGWVLLFRLVRGNRS